MSFAAAVDALDLQGALGALTASRGKLPSQSVAIGQDAPLPHL